MSGDVLSNPPYRAPALQSSAFGALALAASRRVDMIMMGDSHQLKDGAGYDDGFGLALAKRFGMYATPMYTQENSPTGYASAGQASSGTTGANGATTGAPSGQAPFALPRPGYLYQAMGQIQSSNNGVIVNDDNTPGSLGIAGNLRAHFSYGTFASGAGSFRPGIRLEVSPYTTYANSAVINTNTGVDGRAIATLDLPAGTAAAKGGQICAKWDNPGGTASVGPTTEFWCRIENLDRLTGISIHTLYGDSGKSAYDMAGFVQGLSDAQLKNYLQDAVYLQVKSGLEPLVVFYVCTGHNDLNSASSPSLGPLPSSAPTSYQAYIDNIRAIYNRVKAMWLACGFSDDGFRFLLMPSHPENLSQDPANLIAYRSVASRWASGQKGASFVDLGALVTNTELIANGGYLPADLIHLYQATYEYIAQKVVRTFVR